MTALLWDLDGTLLSTARAGVLALEDAAEHVIGIDDADLSDLHTSGLTDAAVAALAIEAVGGLADSETVARFLEVYEDRLPHRLPARRGRVMPNVREILERLAGREGVVSLLLTGNTRRGAAAKLSHYGLDDLLDDGAFCTDGGPREEIARRARALATDHLGREPAADELFVVGDTPHDVAAAQAIGARAIVVATGVHPLTELAALEPWRALEQLPEPDEFERLIGLAG